VTWWPGGPDLTRDSDIVRRCLDGDRVAWADLLGRYADLAYAVLRRAGLDEAAAADAFQEVSLLLWRGLPRLRKTERLVPWIATTARRVAWRATRRARARTGRERAVARKETEGGGAPADALAALEEEQAVRESLAALHERCRRLLRLLYFEAPEGGYDEVARRLGIPRGSIGPTRARCLEGLERELAARGISADVSPGPRAASTPAAGRSGRRRSS